MNQRPKLKIEPSLFNKITIFLTWSTFIFLVVYTYHNYAQLPEIIPSHFNVEGKIDGYSSKSTLWILVGINFLINVGSFALSKFPHKFNYLVKITEENARRQYTLAIHILFISALLTTFLLSFINYEIIKISLENSDGDIGTSLLPIILIVTAIYVATTTYLILKNK